MGKDDIALIVGDLFQRDLVREPSRTLARVSEALTELRGGGLIWRYEANDTALLFVSFWESVQRVDKPQAGRFPRPDGTMNYKDSFIREPDAKPRDDSRNLAPGTGEQGNRGTGEQTPTPDGVGVRADESALPTPKQTTVRGCRLPDEWMPDETLIAEMREQCPGVDLKREHQKFTDYWRAQPGAKGRKTDWPATWRNWIRRAWENLPANTGSRAATSDQRVAAVQALKQTNPAPTWRAALP
ncbi:hypothetical protein [Mycolicibacterium conceptionense]|uniref:hypothetical protein n=1 Tax=Mycolicibacterium conceptionense TaxID=451644 RepID=UPI0010549870|nr:hypothetical protein [Mycolicibacterium conceptionense]